jgi:hypothetical protein
MVCARSVEMELQQKMKKKRTRTRIAKRMRIVCTNHDSRVHDVRDTSDTVEQLDLPVCKRQRNAVEEMHISIPHNIASWRKPSRFCFLEYRWLVSRLSAEFQKSYAEEKIFELFFLCLSTLEASGFML